MPGELTLVATGPLTNAAIALTAHPSLRSLLRGIALMGGAAVGGNRTPCSEFNIHADPDAAEIVFSSGIPIVMCGLDVTEQAWFSPEEFAALPDTPVGRFARAATAGPMQKNMARGAGRHAQQHHGCQDEGKDSFHCFHSPFVFYFPRQASQKQQKSGSLL